MLLGTLLLALPGKAEEVADFYIVTRGGTDLLAQPHRGAAVIAHLPRLSPVVPGKRRRNWRQIQARVQEQTLSGWVPEGAVRQRYRAEKKKSALGMAGVLSWLDNRPERQTAVLGVRGLEEEGASTGGRSDMAALGWVEGQAPSEAEVEAFILEGDLNP